MLIEFTEPDPKTVAFQGHTVEIYYPKIQTVQEFDMDGQRPGTVGTVLPARDSALRARNCKLPTICGWWVPIPSAAKKPSSWN